MVARRSILSWDNLHQLAVITPGDIIEITAAVGEEVEELAQYLEERFPGIVLEFATRYLDMVLASMPSGVLPTREEVAWWVGECVAANRSHEETRELATAFFQNKVNRTSPAWAKHCMMAMIKFSLGDAIFALHEAGFAQNELDDPSFETTMEDWERAIEPLLVVERKKARMLAKIISERRLAG